MLRIAIYYENRLGRNDGNPLYVYAALKRLESKGELSVDHLVPNSDYKNFGKYDAHIVVDWGEDGLTSLLPYKVDYNFKGGVKVYWASDTHLGYDYRKSMCDWADIAFAAQKNHSEKLSKELNKNVIWLPHAVEPRAYNDADDPTGTKPYDFISKKYDICFVGHVNSYNRIEALDRMFSEFPNFFYGQRLFNEAAKKYAESKIVFNIAMKDDLNMRCFEATGSKSFLLTDRVQSIDDVLIDGKHCILYNTLDEAVEKAKYYISHDEERESVAKAGYDHVMANHTIDHRVSKILEEINKLTNKK